MISCESVLNSVYNFARVCPNYKQGIACPKQGNKTELVVLNRVCILGFFCPKQVRVSNPQRLTYTQIWVEYPPGEGMWIGTLKDSEMKPLGIKWPQDKSPRSLLLI